MKLNLGAGKDEKKEGWINVDKFPADNIDIVHDLNKIPYPFDNDSIDEIRAISILEHLSVDTWEFMEEIYRILKPNAAITIIVPHHSSIYAHYENHHKFFSSISFKNGTSLEMEWLNNFEEVERYLSFNRAWYIPLNPLMERIANKYPYLYETTFLKALFPAYQLKVILRKK